MSGLMRSCGTNSSSHSPSVNSRNSLHAAVIASRKMLRMCCQQWPESAPFLCSFCSSVSASQASLPSAPLTASVIMSFTSLDVFRAVVQVSVMRMQFSASRCMPMLVASGPV